MFYANLVISTLFTTFVAGAEPCDNWFTSLKLSPTDPKCELKCASSPVGMNTFECPTECSRLCSTKSKSKKCKLNSYWEKILESSTSPFSPLSASENEYVRLALSRLPKNLRPKALRAIVKSSLKDITSPNSPASSSDEYIILYSQAFANPNDLGRVLLHEILHFMMDGEWSVLFNQYKKELGWTPLPAGKSYREGDFVNLDGKFSVEEDFANNLEYYVFETGTLIQKSKKIHSWINTHLKKDLNLETGCSK